MRRGRFLAYGSIPLAYALGHLALLQLYAVALVSGTTFVFFNIAEVALLGGLLMGRSAHARNYL